MENTFTKDMVNEYADKLLIGLTEEENEMVLKEFNKIDADIKRITLIDGISEVEPMTHCLDNFYYELREDEEVENDEVTDLLSNCDSYIDTEVKVQKVVE